MKKFTFPLGRVLDWRVMLARVEESKLEQMYGELRVIDARKAALDREREQSEQAFLAKSASTGMELAILDSFRRFVFEERIRLEQKRAEVQQRITAQIHVVSLKRRDAKLLERLKDQRFSIWQRDLSREIDSAAEESFLAKRNRSFGRE